MTMRDCLDPTARQATRIFNVVSGGGFNEILPPAPVGMKYQIVAYCISVKPSLVADAANRFRVSLTDGNSDLEHYFDVLLNGGEPFFADYGFNTFDRPPAPEIGPIGNLGVEREFPVAGTICVWVAYQVIRD